MTPELSIVIMAYDEEEALPLVLTKALDFLDERRIDGEIVVVDDGSIDATAFVASQVAGLDHRISIIRHVHNEGMGAAIRTGYGEARGAWVTQLPADGQIEPDTLGLLLDAADDDVDMVLSRYEDRGDGPIRRLLTWGFRAWTWAISGTDTRFTGTMLLRREVIDAIVIEAESFVANIEVPVKALRRGFRSRTITIPPPVMRAAGRSKVLSLSKTLGVALESLRVLLPERLHPPHREVK
jgi:dolichol-phosphate mannosyltransferase